MIESQLVNAVVVGSDSHTTSHGALGAFAFGIGATEMASVWCLGVVLNVEVPKTIKVDVRGRFPAHVGAKDLILHLVGLLTAQGANFRVIEFHGETIRTLPTSGRLTLCNMTVEAGATSGVVPGAYAITIAGRYHDGMLCERFATFEIYEFNGRFCLAGCFRQKPCFAGWNCGI